MNQPWLLDLARGFLARLDLLLPLLAAHLLADFPLQPSRWAARKRARRLSPVLLPHAGVAALLGYAFLARWDAWWLLLYLGVGHALIDALKPRRDGAAVFLADQALHLVHQLGAALLLAPGAPEAWPWLPGDVWLLLVAVLVNWSFAGVLLEQATARWRGELGAGEGLSRAGLWIGRLERLLALVMVLVGRLEAVALLVTAKSIFRFGSESGRKAPEYVLVGTLASLAIAILSGLAAAALLARV